MQNGITLKIAIYIAVSVNLVNWKSCLQPVRIHHNAILLEVDVLLNR